MSATYDATLLTVTPTDKNACMTWVRFWLGDKPDREGKQGGHHLSDEEILASLELAAVGGNPRYYRPHITAKALLVGNPELWESKKFRDYSEKRRDPEAIAKAWAEQGKAFDALIPEDLHTWVEKPKAKQRYYSRVSRFETHF